MNTSGAVTYTPISFDECTCRSTSSMSLITCDFWLTHWIGSVCSVSLSSTVMPTTKIPMLKMTSGSALAAGSEPSHTTRRPSGPSRKSLPFVGDRNSRMPRMASGQDDRAQADGGDADRQQQAELPDHRHLGEAQRGEGEDGVERDDEQGRTEVAGRLLDRMLGAVDDHLFLDARVHLDRVVDADAEHHGQPGDRHDRERDAEVAGEAERPDDADEDDAQRQQSPSHVEQHEEDHDHDRDGDGAEREHAAAQVVVDVLQQDRRTGRHGRRVVELQLVGFALRLRRGRAFLVERLVAEQTRDHLRVRGSRGRS